MSIEIKQFSTSKYERQGFEGIDASLDISLNEYRLIWKLYKRASKKGFVKGEYLFVFVNSINELDWAGNIHETTDLKQEFSWVHWEGMYEYTGTVEETYFKNQGVPYIVADLISYYGTMNVFGS